MKRRSRFTTPLVCLLLSTILATNGGCCVLAGAGVVGIAGGGYVYWRNKSCETYSSSLEETWFATQLALSDLGMPVIAGPSDRGIIGSRTADGREVRIRLTQVDSPIPVDGQVTSVSVRVLGLGDKMVSDRILMQIAVFVEQLSSPGPS